eukprot:IDg3228t1
MTNRPFSRSTLRKLGARQPDDYVFFYRYGATQGSLAALSNFYAPPTPFVDAAGRSYRTNEHYIMHGKAVLFADTAMAAAILDAKTPREAKRLGRRVTPFDDKVWRAHSVRIAADGCKLKFSQCEQAKATLFGTGDRILVEAAPRDRLWGIGMGRNNENRLDPGLWRGENLQGEALMTARAELRVEISETEDE